MVLFVGGWGNNNLGITAYNAFFTLKVIFDTVLCGCLYLFFLHLVFFRNKQTLVFPVLGEKKVFCSGPSILQHKNTIPPKPKFY